jgi:hypothetical protein
VSRSSLDPRCRLADSEFLRCIMQLNVMEVLPLLVSLADAI